MPITSLTEIIYLIILTFAVGYIFSGFIKKPEHYTYYQHQKPKLFNWQDIKFAMLIVAPAVVLHELFHKFSAMFFGLTATFHIFWEGLGLGIFLKLISSPFLIIAPGYVSISGASAPLHTLITAAAGPFANLLLFGISGIILNKARHLTRIQAIALYLTKKINIYLLIFNLIPIPPLDGSKVLFSLLELIKTV